jgi:hypothetical protein
VDPGFSTDGLGTDGIVLHTVGNNLILAGGAPRGTLYAVYTFLEDYVGCHWWSSQSSSIPKQPQLAVGELNRRYVPALEFRYPLIVPMAVDPDWNVRNKCVGQITGYKGLMEAMLTRGGGRHFHPCGHSYFAILPPDKYFGEHPEWYGLIGGKRVTSPLDHASLCLTNQAMQKVFEENFKAEIRHARTSLYPTSLYEKNGLPDPLTFSFVTPEDDSGYPCRCQCEACRAIETAEESPAGLMLQFANQMADAIRSEFPNQRVAMYAYHFSQKPPKITKPASNVAIFFCPIHAASNSRPLTDPRFKRWQNDLEGWMKICSDVYIYDYPDNVTYELLPHPNLRALATNIKNWAKMGIKGYFGDGVARGTGGTEMAELRNWLIAKLLWDPSLDTDALIKTFTDGYYGPAGPSIRAYLDVMHNAVEVSGDWLALSSPPTAHFLSIETLMDGWKHLQQAEAAVKDDPTLLARVKVAQLPVLFTVLVRWDALKDDASCRGATWPFSDERKDTYDIFIQIVKANGVTPSSQTLGLLEQKDK